MSVTITQPAEARRVLPAVGRGLLCRCPNCGKGNLFRAYLKVADTCPACGEDLHHHRADDLPPYLAIFLVGHLLGGVMLHMEMTWHVNPAVYLWTLLPLAIVLPLMLLPSLKGGVVGMQWALRMHGFDPDHPDTHPEDEPR